MTRFLYASNLNKVLHTLQIPSQSIARFFGENSSFRFKVDRIELEHGFDVRHCNDRDIFRQCDQKETTDEYM